MTVLVRVNCSTRLRCLTPVMGGGIPFAQAGRAL